MTMIQIPAQTVPEWLRGTRGAAGLSTRAIGAVVGVSHGTVSKWERGEGEPSVTQFILWCRATKQRPDQMIEALSEMCTPRDLNPEPTDSGLSAEFWDLVDVFYGVSEVTENVPA